MDFGDEYVKENSPYHVIFCKIRKRDEKKFLDALSEMYDKMLLMGYKDYQEVCDNFIRVVEKNGSSMVLLLTSTPPRNTILAYATIGGASNAETSFFLYERI